MEQNANTLISLSRPSLLETFTAAVQRQPEPPKKRVQVRMAFDQQDQELMKSEKETPTLEKHMASLLGGVKGSIERLAFEVDPTNNPYQSLWKPKRRGLPDVFLKRIMIQDDLVAAIVRARETQISSFGRPRPDRFSTGFVIEPEAGVLDSLTAPQREELGRRIAQAVKRFATCGETDGVKKKDQMSFSQYLMLSARNAVGLGRLATELISVPNVAEGGKRFHHFRPTDVGTIFQAPPAKEAEDSVRKEARKLLERLKQKKLPEAEIPLKEYDWVQVIENQPRQFFTEDELVVHNFYPVLDIESDGYPVTPIDTVIRAVTTHIDITKHNQIYFQTGRATRGMLVFRSDDVDENTLARIKQQFQASINSVNNAWRMPVFAVSSNDEISWEPIDNSSRDAEFQYLTDMNARVILSAFQMSPDELPGWSYLSRGTNNQALSESNNEYRLEAARDLGIRPLLQQFEDFINAVLFPLIDPPLSKLCRLKLKGLDADTEEKESVRLQQDTPVHGTYDWIMEKVEKKPLGRQLGGEFPLNPQYQAVIEKYLTFGEIKEKFFDVEGASKDPKLVFYQNPFYFQFLQLNMQAQQAQQAATNPPPGDGGGGPPSGGADSGSDDSSGDDSGGDSGGPSSGGSGVDLSRSIDQLLASLTKAESDLPHSKRKLLAMHRRTVDRIRTGLENDLRQATKDIVDIAQKHAARA